MGNYELLKRAVANIIKANDNQEITGDLLQVVLKSIISTIGFNATFAGLAIPSTNPGTRDENIFYIASTPGTYVNFGGLTVENEVAILENKTGEWTKINTGIALADYVSSIAENTILFTNLDITSIENGSTITEVQQGIIDEIFRTNKPIYCIDKGFYNRKTIDPWTKELSLWYNDTLYVANLGSLNWSIIKKSFYSKNEIDSRIEDIKDVQIVNI